MSVGKINFTSSILSDMTAKAAAFQENKQPEQVVTTTKKQDSEPAVSASAESTADKPKNNAKRNTIVGLSAVAILIGLGVAGRKGKLGPKIQKFLGGAGHAATNKVGQLQTYRIKLPNTETEFAKLDKKVQEEIRHINSVIDRDILKIDDSLKTIKVPSREECLDIIRKDVDIDTLDFSKCTKDLNGNFRYEIKKGSDVIILDFNSDKSVKRFMKHNIEEYKKIYLMEFGKNQAYKYNDYISGIRLDCNTEGKITSLSKQLSLTHSISYNSNKEIEQVFTELLDSGGQKIHCANGYLRCVWYKNGNVSSILYHNPENGRFAKMEILDDTGKIVREQYTLADDTSILLKATE